MPIQVISLARAARLGPCAATLALRARLDRRRRARRRSRPRSLPDFTELVEKVGPAVVNIRTTERARAARGGVGPELDDDMLEFFRRFGIPIPNRPTPRGNQPPGADGEPQQRGVGSGFILSADGYVMTNAHVVDGADEVIVTLTDKREFKARIIGADKRTDVALVKIEATGLPFVRIGDFSRLKVGEWVIAIGSPFGLENTVTAGIVSAKSRDTGDFLPLIQTDVAINPGNSGGPLINMRGEVVGINSQIYSRSGGYMGISFAIPIDEAIAGRRAAARQRARHPRPHRRRDRPGDARKWPSRSAWASRRARWCAASKPAARPRRPASRPATSSPRWTAARSRSPATCRASSAASSRAARRRCRSSAAAPTRICASPSPSSSPSVRVAAPSATAPKPPQASTSSLGLAVSDLTDAQRRELKVKGGVRVDSVEGAAARAGLREGDVILSVDNIEVTNAKQFEALAGKLDKSKPVTLLVRRGDGANFVIVQPGPK